MNKLTQGPSQLNTSFKIVSRVLYAFAEVSFPGDEGDNPTELKIDKNDQNHIIVTCPNGETYNLTIAIRNANLEFFIMPQEIIDKLSESKPSSSRSIEIDAFDTYTTTYYRTINAFLRGQHEKMPENEPSEIKEIFIKSLLVQSATNKNQIGELLPQDDSSENDTIYRLMSVLPPGILSELMFGNSLQHSIGISSFTELVEGSSFVQDNKIIKINTQRGKAQSMKSISSCPKEQEIAMPSTHWFYSDPVIEKHTESQGKKTQIMSIRAEQVHGVSTEKLDHYLSELALSCAYERHLKNPYKEMPDYERNGIYRPNHALAHHVRVVSYVEEVISYFREFARDEDFRQFCSELSNNQFELIKVFMAFSRTGRESETGPKENIVKFRQELLASSRNLSRFLKEEVNMSDEEIKNWTTILEDMGNPNFERNIKKRVYIEGLRKFQKDSKDFLKETENSVIEEWLQDLSHKDFFQKTDSQEILNKIEDFLKNLGMPYFDPEAINDPIMKFQIFIHRIVNLAHKLDLQRCFLQGEYDNAVQVYSPGDYIVESSAKAISTFSKLNKFAKLCLINTGNNLSFYIDGIKENPKGEEVFIKSNKDIFYSLDVCVYAKQIAFRSSDIKIPLSLIENIKNSDLDMDLLNELKRNNPDMKFLTPEEFLNIIHKNEQRATKKQDDVNIFYIKPSQGDFKYSQQGGVIENELGKEDSDALSIIKKLTN